ncbi:hypothetical protein ACFSSC_11300 [Corynebacterium mendelii]|uniref:Uncharacterized protein n=1 Tax=Corynebacterium mendelii TaxID=2765362 RepID=A0A939DZG4_9CORY|nr:hypothetical protein [Corynebacterium mendelii]MBN9643664.1 hypothetical protein [Corynebacterium mendelii]
MNKKPWSFYGATQPAWVLAVAWLAVFALPVITFFAVRIDNGYEMIFICAPLTGLVALAAAVKLRSWLLVVQGIAAALFYWYLAFLYFGLIP